MNIWYVNTELRHIPLNMYLKKCIKNTNIEQSIEFCRYNATVHPLSLTNLRVLALVIRLVWSAMFTSTFYLVTHVRLPYCLK